MTKEEIKAWWLKRCYQNEEEITEITFHEKYDIAYIHFMEETKCFSYIGVTTKVKTTRVAKIKYSKNDAELISIE